MGAALGWGALSASSLLVGALLGVRRRWPDAQVGAVLAFGAGALVSAVSYELVQEGGQVGGGAGVGVGLALGAATYYLADGLIGRLGSGGHGKEARTGGAGTALALGAFLDGIPEQAVLGIGLAAGEGVSIGLIVAIFVSNLPEAIGSATEMKAGGQANSRILRLWAAVAAICTLSTVGGYALADAASGELRAGIDGFAAGALLVMLVDSMIPDATRKYGRKAGLVTTLGFAVAAGLSTVG
jgi:ZIP family zinc transporter